MSSAKTIPSVRKAILVLEFIAERTHAVSVKELSYSLNIPLVSCYRLVRTLLEQNVLREEPGQGFRIAFGIAKLARSYSEIEHALQLIGPLLQELAHDLGLSMKVSLREGYYVTTTLRVEPARPNAITNPVGHRFHIGIGSAASALLSILNDDEILKIITTAPQDIWIRQTPEDVWARIRECRQSGICKDTGQQHPSIFAISTLLTLAHGRAIAITVVGLPEDFFAERETHIISKLKRSTASMQKLLI